jgi:hypothetical protein
MVLRREVHGAISVCSFAPSVPPYPWLRLHLGDVGTPPREAISMASAQTEALDGRSEASTWITGKRTVLPLRPRARIHRPHRRVMLILSGDLVARIYMSPSGDRKCSQISGPSSTGEKHGEYNGQEAAGKAWTRCLPWSLGSSRRSETAFAAQSGMCRIYSVRSPRQEFGWSSTTSTLACSVSI